MSSSTGLHIRLADEQPLTKSIKLDFKQKVGKVMEDTSAVTLHYNPTHTLSDIYGESKTLNTSALSAAPATTP